MKVTCTSCGERYDDSKRWTMCPHARRPRRPLRWLVGAAFFAAIALAVPALADTCQRTVASDGSFTIVCPPASPVQPPPPPPPGPTDPPPPPPPPVSKCPPNLSPFTCLMQQGNPIGTSTGPSTPSGSGFDRLAFDFRDGDSLRIAGGGTRTAVATRSATVSFSVGDMPGNASSERRVTVSVNGRVVEEATGVYVVTRPVPVRAGDTIALTVSGDGAVMANARMALS